jgi:cell division protease FtsH
MSNENKNPDKKKGFPGILIFFIIAAFALLLMKNTVQEEKANVSFSHQIEHLVNLDLLQLTHSNKVAINENLVSFSGKFRDKKSEQAENRFRFLTLLDENKTLKQEEKLSKEKMDAALGEMKKAASYFYELTGDNNKTSEIIIPATDKFGIEIDEVAVNLQSSKGGAVSLKQVDALYEAIVVNRGGNFELQALESKLKSLVSEFRSSKLGIGAKSLKNLLADCETLLQNSTDIATFGLIIKNLKTVALSLSKEVNGVKLFDLRSVRNYIDQRDQFVAFAKNYQDNELKLTKAESKVSDTIWFFNNTEVSSKALMGIDGEKYHRWYLGAKAEWEGFDKNQGLLFRSPDQPRNLVLEKTFKSEQPATNYFSYIFTFVPFLLIGGLMYFVFSKQMKGGGTSAMNFGKSPAKQVLKGQQKITFDDVAGIDDAKEELEELVDFLKDPMRYKNLGARIPKGILLVGAPGTGKTLTAKAVAGEAGVPFFSISGSDFVEMFVGVGASRVRDLFDQARKSSPSIIFIDEIDAVGRHRGSGLGGGHDEREQTLNQLLVEIDGMDTVSGVIIIAATNRPDVLDKALLRPGRFDRSVTVEMPDYYGRLSILKVHAKKVKMDSDVNLKEIARRTTGSVGADLENILNEAALYAAKKRRKMVTQEDLRYAQEKVQFGKERKSMILNDEDIKTTAYHEAGHALCSMMLKTSDEVTMVTRVPRGRSLGATHFELKKNRVSYRKQELIDQLVVLMGGRCAEEIINKDPTSGAQMDIKQATNIARSMVKEWGMSDIVGMINYGDDSNSNLMSGFHEREFSEQTARIIDAEIKKLLDDAYKSSMELLTANFEKLNLMATMLIEFEALDKGDLDKILDGSFSIDDKKRKVEEFESGTRREPPALPKGLKKSTNSKPDQGPALA